MDYRFIKLDKFVFVDDHYKTLNFWQKINVWVGNLSNTRIGAGPTPVELKAAYNSYQWDPFLTELFKAIGFASPQILEIVSFHQYRLSRRQRMRRLLYLIFSLSIFAIMCTVFILFYVNVSPVFKSLNIESANFVNSWVMSAVLWILLYGTVILFTFVIARISNKITATLTMRRFADTVCMLTIAYLIVELSRNDVLTDSEKKISLITRINDLARNTLFLKLRFESKNAIEQEHITTHFRYLERYIREREGWAITPQETTLSDLRRDFYELAEIYIKGEYGKFDWARVSHQPETMGLSRKQRIFKGIPSFLGIVVPLFLLGFLLWQQPSLQSIGIGTNIVALILIAWFLLTIDSTLKLGVVSSVISLAKEIKSLK